MELLVEQIDVGLLGGQLPIQQKEFPEAFATIRNISNLYKLEICCDGELIVIAHMFSTIP